MGLKTGDLDLDLHGKGLGLFQKLVTWTLTFNVKFALQICKIFVLNFYIDPFGIFAFTPKLFIDHLSISVASENW